MKAKLNIYSYREGNFLDVRNWPHSDFCRIEQIIPSDKGNQYVLSHRNSPDKIKRHHSELWGITLEPQHVLKLGFVRHPPTGLFIYRGWFLNYQSFATGTLLALPAMRLFKPGIQLSSTSNQYKYDEILEQTIEVSLVHTFQNYCSDNDIPLDFSVLP